MRPSWRNKAAFSTLRCLFPVTRDSSVGWGTSQVGHLPITLQITARTSSSTWKILASNHSLALHKSSHSAALECFVQIWALGHEAVTFSALHLSFFPKPLCAPASPLMGTDHSSCTGGHRSVSLMGTAAFLEDVQALWWEKVKICLPHHQVGGNGWQAALIWPELSKK